MAASPIALTGPAAAAGYGLDGFRNVDWPSLWATPEDCRGGERLLRVRDWKPPVTIGEVPLCPVETVVRHLNAVPADLEAPRDGITPRDRVELAVEHALRDGHDIRAAPGGSSPGDRMLREILRLRRRGTPPTESYAETRAVQLLRSWEIVPWRQLPIVRNGVIAFRADFMIPFRRMRPPAVVRPVHGLLLEIDSQEFHEQTFERDHRRGLVYTQQGFHWMTCTPNQIEHDSGAVRRALIGALARVRSSYEAAVSASGVPGARY